ncbi:MAG: DNA polymerase I [Streptosporangiales bacterium]|nr:DNA polymerase I [Streptosporangiales bacterium]
MTSAAEAQTPGRLLLLDGHSLAYRAFYALKDVEMSTTDGQPTNAVYGFTSMLINVLRDEEPTHLAVAFDRSGPTFRHQAYDAYKANRAVTPDDFRGQVSLIEEVLTALRIPMMSASGFEADDVIATLSYQAGELGMEVLILTGDRDAFQLVGDRTTVLYPRKGVSDLIRMDPAAVETKYGVPPGRYRDLAALVGESSDNLSGVPGVGPKTAAKWILKYDGIDGIVEHADEITGKAGQSLRDHLGDVLRNHQLNRLEDDVELPVTTPAELVMGQWDRDEIHTLFDSLQFRVLRERLYQSLSAAEPEADEGFEVDMARPGPGEVEAWLAAHARDGSRVGIALDGTWGRGGGTFQAIAIANGAGTGAYLEAAELSPEDERALGAWLADLSVPKALHDVKGPMLALRSHGFELRGVTSDTALAAYLALPGQRTFDLADLSLRYLHRELRTEGDDSGQLTLDGSGEEEAQQALVLRAAAVVDLAAALDADLERRGATRLLREVELPLTGVLGAMERTGISADHPYLSELEAQFAAAVKQAVEEAHRIVGREFNLGSPKQLQEILFTELELPKTKRIKTGYTTDADALAWLSEQTENELPTVLLRHRDQTKLRTTVEGLIKTIADDGRIHTTFNQMVAATGRLSSADPNLQNIPIRTAEGRRIRRAFVVGTGFETLFTADYSQIELRIMAHLSGDEELIAAFESGHDFHAETAARVFDMPAEQIDSELRARIKAMNYGLAYGLSAFGLSQQLGISPDEARGLMEEYFQRFGGVRDFLRDVVERARKDGYTETMLGRRRYLPDLTSDNRQRREMAERMALNAPIQGSAADIIKVAMLRVDKALREEGLTSRMLLQVHDELVFEVAAGELDRMKELVPDQMGAAYPLRVPLAVSVGVGPDWDVAGH